MKNKPEELPQIAIKFANIMFMLGFFFCVLIAVYASYRIFNPTHVAILGNKGLKTFYIIVILCGGVFATLFGVGLKRLSNNLKVNLSMLFFMVGIVVYGFEIYLEFSKKTPREIIAKQMGVPYDTRTYVEVLDDLIDSGVKAFPNVRPKTLNGLTAKKGRIYPLGTISNSTTTFKNESGYYPIFETDEHGFNNPKGLYKKNNVDIMLTGDSYTEGNSVHSNETISAVLRQLDFNTISVGKGGNGSLIELAALKEYAEPLEPKIILWLYVHDLNDLENEMQSSILRKYLNEDDYSQNLISRQEEIDGVLINYVQRELTTERIKILKRVNLRRMINLTPTPTPTHTPTPIPTSTLRDVLQKAKQMVSGWDGEMYFVYLPSFYRYYTGNEHADRDFIMQTATELDIPIIDIHSKVFAPHSDPLSLFPLRINGHYNAEGYKLVAEVIGKRLKADGYVTIKSNK